MTKLTSVTAIQDILGEMSLREKVRFLTTVTACISQHSPEHGVFPLILADGTTGPNSSHIILDFLAETANQHPEWQHTNGSGENPFDSLIRLPALEEGAAVAAAGSDPMQVAFLEYLKKRRNDAGRFVSFPSGINIGAMFDTDAAYRIGQAVGEEIRAANISVCLGPNVDIMRDPLGGRNYEMYGEDPVLVGRTAAAFIQGMQSTGTMACAKHYLCNNQETNRQAKNTHVSLRTMKELYARGFKAAVQQGGVKAVMSAYNAVNGCYSSYNQMTLTDWLKEEWGFDGFVVSDWGAVTGEDHKAIAAGMDMILYGGHGNPNNEKILLDALAEGTLTEKRVDDALARILRATLWHQEAKEAYPLTYDQEKLLNTAYKTVADSIVLLKNNGVLPLAGAEKISIVGSAADTTMECGSGSTFVTTPLHGSLTEECQRLGFAVCEDGDTLIYAAKAEGGENADRPGMTLEKGDEDQIATVLRRAKEAGKGTVVVLNVAGPIDMRAWIKDADAIVCEFVPGCMGAKATAAVLAGREAPGGKLPMTFPFRLEDSPASPYECGEHNDIFYSEGVFVGHRWYEKKDIPVQYPFGYGLSYTTFACSVTQCTHTWDLRQSDCWSLTAQVCNTGAVRGAEVLQLYLGQQNPRIPMPVKELMAFAKVWLEPGETKEVTLMVDAKDLMVFDPQKGQELLPTGTYTVTVGTSSRNGFFTGELAITGKNPYVLDENSTLGEIFTNQEAVKILAKYLPQIARMTPEHVKIMANQKIGALLSKYLIAQIPDANALNHMLSGLYEELAAL